MKRTGKGSNYHPARISGHQKMLRAKQANEDLAESTKQRKLEVVNITGGNWSIRKQGIGK